MIPIELKMRYPHSRVEDITDAFMRGYQAHADVVQGGDAEMDNCQVQAPQNYMQQSRHDDGKDLISRADAIEAVCCVCDDDGRVHYPQCGLKEYCLDIKALLALPSADAVPQLKQTDTLIIADALRYFINDEERHELDKAKAESLREQILKYGASMCKGGDDE